jgi:hypothetical protein
MKYFCTDCGQETDTPIISECGMPVCGACNHIGGIISHEHRHIDALREWLDKKCCDRCEHRQKSEELRPCYICDAYSQFIPKGTT